MVEWGSLLRSCLSYPWTEGSNPSLSAIHKELPPFMPTLSACQTFFLGILLNAIGIVFLFQSFEIQVIAWTLILIGSIVLFLAGYLWFNNMIAKLGKKTSQKDS